MSADADATRDKSPSDCSTLCVPAIRPQGKENLLYLKMQIQIQTLPENMVSTYFQAEIKDKETQAAENCSFSFWAASITFYELPAKILKTIEHTVGIHIRILQTGTVYNITRFHDQRDLICSSQNLFQKS